VTLRQYLTAFAVGATAMVTVLLAKTVEAGSLALPLGVAAGAVLAGVILVIARRRGVELPGND
jgi:hypothetical protein